MINKDEGGCGNEYASLSSYGKAVSVLSTVCIRREGEINQQDACLKTRQPEFSNISEKPRMKALPSMTQHHAAEGLLSGCHSSLLELSWWPVLVSFPLLKQHRHPCLVRHPCQGLG